MGGTSLVAQTVKNPPPNAMHDTGCLGLVLWDDPEGCYGGEEGGGFRMGSTCIPEADSF